MWKHFTESARRVVLLGQEEAGKRHALSTDTPHLLLGIFAVDEAQIFGLLHAAGVDANATKQNALMMADKTASTHTGEPKLSDDGKQSFTFAIEEVRGLQHKTIDVEHLLLGLLRMDEERGTLFLKPYGAQLETMRATVDRAIKSQQENADCSALLRLLERRPDLLVEILGVSEKSLPMAKLRLLLRLNRNVEAEQLKREIESQI